MTKEINLNDANTTDLVAHLQDKGFFVMSTMSEMVDKLQDTGKIVVGGYSEMVDALKARNYVVEKDDKKIAKYLRNREYMVTKTPKGNVGELVLIPLMQELEKMLEKNLAKSSAFAGFTGFSHWPEENNGCNGRLVRYEFTLFAREDYKKVKY